jgi:uncharacterized protein
MLKQDYITREGAKWLVHSEAGKELGSYDTEAEANERLREIEAAKAAKKTDRAPTERRRYCDTKRRYIDTEPIESFERTPSGGLRINANISRVGVFPYQMEDGSTRWEYRSPEEVLHPDAIESFRGAPVTDLHPEGFVDPTNHGELAKGTTLDVAASPPFVRAVLDINDAQLMQTVIDRAAEAPPGEMGSEVSCGYEADFDGVPGRLEDGTLYDGSQRGIRGNHVAIGPKGWGRQGASVSLRRDSGPGTSIFMLKQVIDGVEYEAGTKAHCDAVDKLLAANVAHVGSLAKAEQVAKDATARADAAEKKLDPKAIARLVAERSRLIDTARVAKIRAARRDHKKGSKAREEAIDKAIHYLDAEEEAAATDSDSIIIAALQSMNPGFDPEGLDSAGLLGALKFACSNSGAMDEEDDEEGEELEGGEPAIPDGGDEEMMGAGDEEPYDAKGEGDPTQPAKFPPPPAPGQKPKAGAKMDARRQVIAATYRGNPKAPRYDARTGKPSTDGDDVKSVARATRELRQRSTDAWKPKPNGKH